MIRNTVYLVFDASAVDNGNYSGEDHGMIPCLHVYWKDQFSRAKRDNFQLIQTGRLLQLVADEIFPRISCWQTLNTYIWWDT